MCLHINLGVLLTNFNSFFHLYYRQGILLNINKFLLVILLTDFCFKRVKDIWEIFVRMLGVVYPSTWKAKAGHHEFKDSLGLHRKTLKSE